MPEDQATTPAARGLIVKQDISEPANYRATLHLTEWLKRHDIPGIGGIDTRALVRRLREGGTPAFPPAARDAQLLGGTIYTLLDEVAGEQACVDLASELHPGGPRPGQGSHCQNCAGCFR